MLRLIRETEENEMHIITKAIVSNTEMIKNYKACRQKAESNGKIFVFKNNQPDSVLFSIAEYERISVFVEYAENLEEKEIAKFTESLRIEKIGKATTTDNDEMI